MPGPPVEVAALPSVRRFGRVYGRDNFQALCRTLFAEPNVKFVRDEDDTIIVFRNSHLRELAVHPCAGNVPPDELARGRFAELRDPEQAPAGQGAALIRTVAAQIFSMNDDLHDSARAILVRQLSPKAAARLGTAAAEIVSRLLDRAPLAESFDFHAQVSERLTAAFWGAFVGMTPEEIEETPHHVAPMSAIFFEDPSAEETQSFDLGAERYAALVRGAARRACADGGSPLLMQMAHDLSGLQTVDDPQRAGVTPRDIGDFMAGNLLDAFHTAALGVTNAVSVAARQPGLFDRLRLNPALAAAAALEALRLEPPVLFLNRYALDDIVIDGVRIARGSKIAMAWAAGNFDPQLFTEPFTFDLQRRQRGACTFGAGPQICPGRLMATMLATETLKAIAERDLELAVGQDVQWLERSAMAQTRALPVQVHAARRADQANRPARNAVEQASES